MSERHDDNRNDFLNEPEIPLRRTEAPETPQRRTEPRRTYEAREDHSRREQPRSYHEREQSRVRSAERQYAERPHSSYPERTRRPAPSSPSYERRVSPPAGRSNRSSGGRDNKPALWKKIVLDIAITGVALIIFALFHHVLPAATATEGVELPNTSAVTQTAEPTATPVTSTDPAASAPPADTSTQPVSATMFSFPDKFTDGEPETTDTSYKGKNVNVSYQKVQQNGIAYVVTDIYVSDIKYFRTGFAEGEFREGTSAWTLDMATANNAVAAMSGDYYGIRDMGVVVRNGKLYRETPWEDVLVMYNDGTMKTFSPDAFSIDEIKSTGAWQIWSFGPMLLTDGKAMQEFNSKVNPKNPRSAIGYFEPGHYCFVTVDGRQEGYSEGMTLQELSSLMESLGCTVAYNLDGGQSSCTTFGSAVVNQPYDGGRKTSDIVYVTDAEQ